MARPKILTDEEAAERRKEASRKAQAKRRAAIASANPLEIRLTFTGELAETLRRLRDETNGNPENWALECFTTGAAFRFNSGNTKGGKARVRRGAI